MLLLFAEPFGRVTRVTDVWAQRNTTKHRLKQQESRCNTRYETETDVTIASQMEAAVSHCCPARGWWDSRASIGL